MFNNIYVKNFPDDWTEANLRQHFSKFGQVQSTFMNKSQAGPFAFICFGSDNLNDREYGPKCATKAIEGLNGIEFGDKTLFVGPALKKSEREKELAHESYKYRSSKKRCNLYVKNFALETTEADLKDIFSAYGEIESMKLFASEGQTPFAFVCFKTPDVAT